MREPRFRDRLKSEFAARRHKNPRYSLRAFAAFLGADHSTLSQILRGARRVPLAQIRRWAKKMEMSPEEASAYVAAEHVPDAATHGWQEYLRHWTAEAIAVVTDRTHWQIVRLCRTRGFRADSRWIAAQAGTTADAVNLALSRLLRLRLLQLESTGRWSDQTGIVQLTEARFQKLALTRVREMAAEDRTSRQKTSKKSTGGNP